MRPLLVLGALTVLGAVTLGAVYGLPAGLLVLLGGAVALSLSLVWTSLLHVTGSEPLSLDEALSLAAPTATEEQKRAALRTLRDLEYELSVGKISQKDYDAASREGRSLAKRLIALSDRTLDEGRARALEKLEERLRSRTPSATEGVTTESSTASTEMGGPA